ncbi:MAG: SusC/RagA family TonB-linked outer membrane protein [Chitinispirillaceae bacterium]|nr:SusC/RagA family TonB-linked outer membrane protein [Chitinispirillaceae bacterium]
MKRSMMGICALAAAGILFAGARAQEPSGVRTAGDTIPEKVVAPVSADARTDSVTGQLPVSGGPAATVKPAAGSDTVTAMKPVVARDTAAAQKPSVKRDTAAKEADSIAGAGAAATMEPVLPADAVPEKEPVVQADTVAAERPVVEKPVLPASVTARAAAGPDTVSAREADEQKVLELEKEVVVGYGTMKKEDLTGSVVSVKSDELARDAAFSVRKALQGRAAGVSITQNSGAPGKAMTVRIRGVGTINNSDPLYVVDGAPVSGIDFLNPNDIESISILKDASATAIYGSRGANGVVMVTTKKAKEGINRVTYDMYVGTQQPWKKPSLCNAEQWAILNNEARRAANLPVYPELDDPSSLGEGTNWFDEVIRDNALIQQQTVSVTRGTDKLKYYMSAGYFDQEGIVRGSGLEKLMFRFNTENKIADWISVGNNFGLARFTTDHADESDEWNSVLVNALAIDPVSTPRDDTGKLAPSAYNNMKNPVGIVENTNITAKKIAFSGTLYSAVSIFDVLKLRSTFGIDMGFNDSANFYPKYYISASDRNDNAVVTRKATTDNAWVFENTVTFERTFADDHSVKLLAGGTAQERGWDSVFAQNQTTPSNDSALRVLDATIGLSPRVRGLLGGNSLASGFSRLEYDYGNKYLLTFTFRTDGSSRFAPDKRWGNFPSAAGAWKVTQEPFMANVPFVEGLKLRAGWGITGNQEIGDYLYTTTTSSKQDYPIGGTINPGTTFLSSGNDQIHWEQQEATNAGLDLTAFDGRIEFLADVFLKKTTGMLVQPTIPAMAGLKTSPMVNGGSIENRGVELVLNYRESIGGFLSNLGINFSTYANEVLSLGENDEPIADADFLHSGLVTRTEVGHPIGCFYGYKTDGLFQSWDEVNAFTYVDKDGATQLVQPNAAPGDIRYRDDDHDGQWDKGYIGSPHPDFIMGLNADVAYKGFDLNITLQGVYGNQVFNGTRWYTENGAGFFNLDTRMLDRWTGEGSVDDKNLPRMSANDANNRFISDRYVEDGSYARVKTLQLGYTLNESLSGKFLVKKCRFYVGAENLFTLTRYTGLEPEVGLTEARTGTKNSALSIGLDRTTYPQARTYLAGMNVTL